MLLACPTVKGTLLGQAPLPPSPWLLPQLEPPVLHPHTNILTFIFAPWDTGHGTFYRVTTDDGI